MARKSLGLDDLIYKYIDKKKEYSTLNSRSTTSSKNMYAKRVEIKNIFKNQVEDRLKEPMNTSTKPLRQLNRNGSTLTSGRTSMQSSINQSSQAKAGKIKFYNL